MSILMPADGPMKSLTGRAPSTAPADKHERGLRIAIPEPDLELAQDEEWFVVQVDGNEWQEVQVQDYAALYTTPGLYERVVYDLFACRSPMTIRTMLEAELQRRKVSGEELSVLDLGAGNGAVGEEVADLGARHIVGIDILPQAAVAAWRDRPGIYSAYFTADITRLSERERAALNLFDFNCLTCVAALGFGDIPPRAFATAFNLIVPEGIVAFTIKEDFLGRQDRSGFARLIERATAEGVFEVSMKKRYQHRLATNGEPLYYAALIATKHKNIGPNLLSQG